MKKKKKKEKKMKMQRFIEECFIKAKSGDTTIWQVLNNL